MKKPVIILILALRSCQQCPAGITAETIFAEARGEGREGMIAVASVIWNRAHGNPEKLETVCMAPWQFSCWNLGYVPSEPRNELERGILKFLEGIESQMLDGRFQPLGTWDHYCRTDCFPSWRAEMTNTKIIGEHIFGCCR